MENCNSTKVQEYICEITAACQQNKKEDFKLDQA